MSPLFDLGQPLSRVLRGLYAAGTLARAAYLDRSDVTTSVAAAIHAEHVDRLRFNHEFIPDVDLYRVAEGRIAVFEGTRVSGAGLLVFDRYLRQAGNLLQMELPGVPGMVGRYWGEMIGETWQALRQRLALSASEKVVFVGHSLGGVLALLCAHLLEAEQPGKVQGVLTFAMPRAGNAAFVLGMRMRHWRVFNLDDPIPSLPPETVSLGFFGAAFALQRFEYAHHGKAVSFDRLGRMYVNAEERYFSIEGRTALAATSEGTASFWNHVMADYLRRIRWQFWRGVSEEEIALDDLNNQLNFEDGATWRVLHVPGETRYVAWEGETPEGVDL